jgi:hypothetical protein
MERNFNPSEYNEPNWNIESYDIVRHYLEIHNSFPNNTIFVGVNNKKGYVRYDKLIAALDALSTKPHTILKANTYNAGVRKHYMIVDGVFLLMENIHIRKTESLDMRSEEGEFVTLVGSLTVLHNTAHISHEMKKLVESCMVKAVETTTIAIISRDSSGFYLSEIPMDMKMSHELELHYGEGFSVFHEKLVNKLTSTSKGLTLLHGNPGTGKSSYIRKLTHDLKQVTSKKIIIVPNSLITHLADPDFNSFLLETVESFHYDEEFGTVEVDDDGVLAEEAVTKGMILILEDAESVLMKREDSYNNQGTSNILNLTDGLLNDIFGIQIIATYNSSDDKIDDAMKRSRRLIAKKSFKSLSAGEAKKLAAYLGASEAEVNSIKNDMNVCDIYAMMDKETEDILIEKVDTNPAMGF